MKMFTESVPLTEAELDCLEEFLENCKGGNAMNVEELDGFFAALIAGPEIVMPSEYLPEVFGGEISDACEFDSLDEANDTLAILMRHWNDIAHTLGKDEVYVPLLSEDENGVARGNDWARGFMRGVYLRPDGWKTLIADEDHAGCIIPMLMLYHEHDEDATMRPEPISPDQREEIIEHMAAGLLLAYRYFRQHGQRDARTREPERRHTNRKIGRNDPCPCGSGKKYKRCCGGGAGTIH